MLDVICLKICFFIENISLNVAFLGWGWNNFILLILLFSIRLWGSFIAAFSFLEFVEFEVSYKDDNLLNNLHFVTAVFKTSVCCSHNIPQKVFQKMGRLCNNWYRLGEVRQSLWIWTLSGITKSGHLLLVLWACCSLCFCWISLDKKMLWY